MSALDRLREIFPPSRMLTEAAQLGAYESDALTAFHSRPVAIVIPETQDEVIAAVRICRDTATPFVARGSGTSTYLHKFAT